MVGGDKETVVRTSNGGHRRVSFSGRDHRHVIPCNGELLEEETESNLARNSFRSSSESNTSSASLSSSSTSTISIPSLHQSVVRNRKKNPFRYYDALDVLGDGSMGSVSRIKKRHSSVGGSARKSYIERERGPVGLLRGNTLCGFAKKILPCLSLCPCSSGSEKFKKGAVETASEIAVGELQRESESFDSIPPDELLDLVANKPISEITDVYDNVEETDCKLNNSKHSNMVSFEKEYDVEYALKSILIDEVTNVSYAKELQNEVTILQTLDHPNICKVIETYEYRNHVYLVLELCSGGDLYTRDPYNESQARHIIRSILDGCAYLHKKKITHRDLKFENIMFASPTSPNVKIIDFGLSKKYLEHETMTNTVGTVYTMAPEVVIGRYDQSCDVWSIGVIAFMLLSSSLPFYGPNREAVLHKIMAAKFGFRGRRWKETSDLGKNLVRCLLSRNVKARPSCARALEHDWFGSGSNSRSRSSSISQDVSATVMDRVLATIQTFAGYSKLKKLALYVIAHKSTSDEIGFLQQLFKNRFDVAKDGIVTLHEFKTALEAYSYTDQELEDVFSGIDIDGTGIVSYNEFLAATIEAHGCIEESRIAEAFDRMDNDDSGYITVANLNEFLGPGIGENYIDSILDEVGETSTIGYDAFLGLWDGSFDDVLVETLRSVRQKRLSRERGITAQVHVSSGEVGTGNGIRGDDDDVNAGDENYEDVDDHDHDDDDKGGGGYGNDGVVRTPAPDALGSAPINCGKHLFAKEKEKSLRGVWI